MLIQALARFSTGGYCTKLTALEKRHPNMFVKLMSSVLQIRLPNFLGVIVVIGFMGIVLFLIGFVMYLSVDDFMGNIDK